MVENLDKVYLVVGASGSIGSQVVRSLASKNNVILGVHYHKNVERIQALTKEMKQARIKTSVFQADLSTEEACNKLIDSFVEQNGRIDGLVTCFGGVFRTPWQNLTWGNWSEVLIQHCLSPISLAQRAVKYMLSQRFGRIVYLSSISPKYSGSSKSIHYAASKGALEIAMRGLARECASNNVTINGVRSGFIMTDHQKIMSSAQELKERTQKILIGRPIDPREVAEAVMYFLSEYSSSTTSDILTVAGGD